MDNLQLKVECTSMQCLASWGVISLSTKINTAKLDYFPNHCHLFKQHYRPFSFSTHGGEELKRNVKIIISLDEKL